MQIGLTVATILLIVSAMGGAIDIVYLHLWKYRLYRGPETIYEHKIHTIQAFLSSLTVVSLFCFNFGGCVLWLCVAVILVGLGIELLDIFCERESRASTGGISSFEYALHVLISGIKLSFMSLVLSSKPPGAWAFDAPFLVAEEYSFMTRAIGWIVFAFGITLTIIHIWLMHPRYRSRPTRDA